MRLERGFFEKIFRYDFCRFVTYKKDRVFKPCKHLGCGRSGTKPDSLLRSEISIRITVWDVNIPGTLEFDTVGHFGGDESG
jgi:hypothetical protein